MSDSSDDMETRLAVLEMKLSELEGDRCPAWQDGKHCYMHTMIAEEADINRLQARKLCLCGARVKPR